VQIVLPILALNVAASTGHTGIAIAVAMLMVLRLTVLTWAAVDDHRRRAAAQESGSWSSSSMSEPTSIWSASASTDGKSPTW
jgi:hypothetical protein